MLSRIKPFNWYTHTGSYLSIRNAAWLFLSSLLLGTLGFMWLEGYTPLNAFYMTVITISTVGYTEVQPLSDQGKVFSSFLILLNIGIVAYSLSAFTFYIVQGEFFKNMHLNFLNKKISDLKDHVILCGYGKYGKEIVQHFKGHQVPFVVIERDPTEIENLQKGEDRLLYIEDDATHDDALVRAGIHRARALISALPDDSENLFLVLSARQLNPRLNIISRAIVPKTQRKLMLAGANHVVMPEQIGGFYMATLVSKPGAIEFFTFITSHYGSDIDFDEIHFEELPVICQGKSIRELRIRKITGANIIGFKKPDGAFVINPSPETRLTPQSSFIVFGNSEQLKDLRYYLENLTEKDLED